MAAYKKIYIFILPVFFVGASLGLAQTSKSLQQPDEDSDYELSLGNQGVLYQKPELTVTTPPKKPKVEPIKKPPVKKFIKPKPIQPKPLKIEPKKPVEYLEEVPQKPSGPQEPAKETNQDVIALKAQLEKTQEQLALANKRIQELEQQTSAKKATPTYVVKKGESLWSIAKKKDTYGDPYKWLLLYHANRDQIYDPNLIFPYMVLFVPQFEEYGNKTRK